VKCPTPIQINESLQLFDSDIVLLLKGKKVKRALSASDIAPTELGWKLSPRDRKISAAVEIEDVGLFAQICNAQGATEVRVSKSLGVAPSTLADLSAALWQRTFSDERDRRAGEGANAQKRGQVSRTMRAELRTAIEEALDDYPH
jgi:hypothetical protein